MIYSITENREPKIEKRESRRRLTFVLLTSSVDTLMKDFFGTALSGLCVVHCLLAPALLLLGSSGAIAYWAHSLELHLFFFVGVVALAVLSFPAAYSRHKKPMPIVMGVIGTVFLLLALLAESLYHWHVAETVLTIVGGVLMISAHMSNKRLLAFQASPSMARVLR